MTKKIEQEVEFEVITRNFSTKVGYEMFSLTATRRVDSQSSFYRKRAEMYLALHDVEIQVLEELVACGLEEKSTLDFRKAGLRKQVTALVKLMKKEIESGTLTDHQIQLNNETFIDIDARFK